MSFKCRVNFVATPDNDPEDEIDIHMQVELPFIPTAGTALRLTANGEYLKVHEIYLDLVPGGEGILVWIDLEEPVWPISKMLAEGWQITYPEA